MVSVLKGQHAAPIASRIISMLSGFLSCRSGKSVRVFVQKIKKDFWSKNLRRVEFELTQKTNGELLSGHLTV